MNAERPCDMVPEGNLHSKLQMCVLKRNHVIVHFGPFRGWLAGLFSNKNSGDEKQWWRPGFPKTARFLQQRRHGDWKDQALLRVLADGCRLQVDASGQAL